MNNHFNLTIKELPKTKKMQVDEKHPLLKLQQNVRILSNLRNLRMKKTKRSMKLELFMEAQCQ